MITELKSEEVFVFGSNIAGAHMAGAARTAYEKFGAVWGVGAGLMGQSYAIPTMGGLLEMQLYINQFIEIAKLLPNKRFLVTKLGCGIAGHSEDVVKPMFSNVPSNVILPKDWVDKGRE